MYAFDAKKSLRKPYFISLLFGFPDVNSISCAELELAGFRDGVTSNRAV
jgi:hypothetical protein